MKCVLVGEAQSIGAGLALAEPPPGRKAIPSAPVPGCQAVALTQIAIVVALLARLRCVRSDRGKIKMANLIALWHTEHVRFSRLLDLLEMQVAEFHDGESPNFGLMLDIVSYLREYADSMHHPREDAAFARLVIRDPTLRLPINRLLQEHRVIALAGEELAMRLNEVIADAVVLRATVEAAAAQYLAYYRHHLATEERDILPRADRLLTAQDWDLVAASTPSCSDPLFGDPPSDAYRELRELMEARASAA